MVGSTLRVASVPFVSRDGDCAHNAAQIAACLVGVAREGIALAVFPELCLSGYTDTAKLSRASLDALAEPLDGASIRTVAAAVERTGVACGVGLIERAPDGRLFNSHVMCLPDGALHCHRKLHAAEHRRIVSGDRYTVFDTGWGVRIGILTGGDSYLVENVRMTALLGASVLIAPHRSGRASRPGEHPLQPLPMMYRSKSPVDTDTMESMHGWLCARAADNGMFIVFSDSHEASNDQATDAAAVIVDPSGRVLAASGTPEGYAAANLDLALIERSRGRQWLAARRPDLYALLAQSAADRSRAYDEPPNASARGSVALGFAVVSRHRLMR
ncbi:MULTISPECIES: nitrilase-related carbon-nitrogen hydrolase [Paraburkholderia]|uniref:nitrilase-related carbon-nitrogen hydrolase n=1 Tax=Paraburkholderia TaxID=1822464 RepID=UPI0022528F9E|nr:MULTISPECIES: nitrilase-related carbon-nitrogen hydrolase [Paraburkholderia]MCX4163517.1 carbon-nitrogen hydrolase [Paraburkholderia megapolitana]MDN7159012.1 carbon-nitrogen hydrolase [Paraburkholderia sp. CHISQ3]MDQ6496059.1 carbon-nitrogen hydrolase [Paraburkholderia megapolitana]